MPEIGRRVSLEGDVVVVGRDKTADLMVARTSISRRHAELRRSGRSWTVCDMGSTNGTFLNEVEVEDAELEDGDLVQFGDAIFKFATSPEAYAYHDKVYSVTVLDGLTSIYNQRYFFGHLEKQMCKAQRVKSDMALIMIDLDWFSELNEERGELCGDAVLRTLSRRLSMNIEPFHVCARIGGEEFAVLLPGGELDDALDLAESLRETVDCEPFAFEGNDFEVSISVGVAASAEGELTAEQLVEEARKQLTCAKTNGRNCVAP